MSQSVQHDVLASVWTSMGKVAIPVLDASIHALRAFCGVGSPTQIALDRVREALIGIATLSPGALDVATERDAVRVRTRIAQEFLQSIGVEQSFASEVARLVMRHATSQQLRSSLPEAIAARQQTLGRNISEAEAQRIQREEELQLQIERHLRSASGSLAARLTRGQARLERLEGYRDDFNQPWDGASSRTPRPSTRRSRRQRRRQSRRAALDNGIDQIDDVFSDFPEIADEVYARAGLRGIRDYPPRRVGPTSRATETFVRSIEEHREADANRETFFFVAFIIGGIAAGVFVGPALAIAASAAMMVPSVKRVLDADRNVRRQHDKLAAGLGDGTQLQQRLEVLEKQATGARRALLIEAVGASVAGRIATRTWSVGAKSGAIAAVGASAGGLSMAADPLVWERPDVEFMLLIGTVVGASGGALYGASQREFWLLLTKPLKPGSTVKIAAPGASNPTSATVSSVDASNKRVSVASRSGSTTIGVESVVPGRASRGLRSDRRLKNGPVAFDHNRRLKYVDQRVRDHIHGREVVPDSSSPYFLAWNKKGGHTPDFVRRAGLRFQTSQRDVTGATQVVVLRRFTQPDKAAKTQTPGTAKKSLFPPHLSEDEVNKLIEGAFSAALLARRAQRNGAPPSNWVYIDEKKNLFRAVVLDPKRDRYYVIAGHPQKGNWSRLNTAYPVVGAGGLLPQGGPTSMLSAVEAAQALRVEEHPFGQTVRESTVGRQLGPAWGWIADAAALGWIQRKDLQALLDAEFDAGFEELTFDPYVGAGLVEVSMVDESQIVSATLLATAIRELA